jgi:hypothetical protein
MPKFEFTSPEGKSYEVNGPEGSTKEQAFDKFKEMRPELFATKTEPSQTKSFLKSFAEGLPSAGGGLAGAELGAMAGTPLGPLGMLGGGLIGGIGGGLLGQYAGEKAMKQAPEDVKQNLGFSQRQRSRETQAFPITSTIGEIVPSLATMGVGFGPRVVKGGTKALIGESQPATEELARKMEAKGYQFEPAQIKADNPISSPGASEAIRKNNELLATKEASNKTGEAVENITSTFVNKKLKEKGEVYDKIFGRDFTIDQDLVNTVNKAAQFESSVNPAGLGAIKSTAANISQRFENELINQTQKQIQNRITNILKQQGRGGVAPITRLKRDWPTLRHASDAGAPQWAADVEKSIHELSDQLGLRVKPQVWFSAPRREGLFGMATGDGHIIINDTLDASGAVSTALHEFGHQAEFQLFSHAPSNVQNEVIRSFREQMQSIPMGVKTMEQHRPITSQKYGESARKQIPDAGFEKSYLRDFSEWFAEQTSRWITTTATPKTVVEKFFKTVADSWKQIYNKVSGYIPMTQSINDFFRSNWKGDLLNAVDAEAGITKSAQSAPIQAMEGENVLAKIDGKELQRLRSNLTDIARNSTDGANRKVAGDFVNAIDKTIEKYHPKEFESLQKNNREYAAVRSLADGLEPNGFVKGGKVSPEALGKYVASKSYGYGAGTSTHPLYELGYAGEKLGMRSREEGVQLQGSELAKALGASKLRLAAMLGTRSQLARKLQRTLSEPKE